MAFCGQCGLLLNTNIPTCPRCGTQTDFDAATSGTPTNDNSATIIAQTDNSQPSRASYTPQALEMPSPDATKAAYYPAPERNAYPGQRPSQPGDNSYATPGSFNPNFPSDGSNSLMAGGSPPNFMLQASNQAPAQGMYQPGVLPSTNPGYPYPPPRKTHKGLIFIIIVLIVALLAVSALLFAVGSNQFAAIFGTKNTPTTQSTSITQATATTPPTVQSSQAPQTIATTTSVPTQQAQATIQQYYVDINAQNFLDAYNLWVSNPDTYDHFKQGFAQTHHDAITLGNAVTQTDGTVLVYLTVQATEDAAGGGTQLSTYQGYYTVGQQTDGSWKIINGQLG
jgi:hypothetical protein